MLSRRDLLRRSALLALTPSVPAFLARSVRGALPDQDGRILVVVQLDGGNDGLNTVVPFGDEQYARQRPVLRLPPHRVVKLNDQIGLHPSLEPMAKLLEDGWLAVVQGVGYPNPNRSHFESMAIWHTARTSPDDEGRLGWIGRTMDAAPPTPAGEPAALLVGTNSPPLALRGTRGGVAAITEARKLPVEFTVNPLRAMASAPPAGGLAAYVHQSMLDAYTTAERLSELASTKTAPVSYPATQLGDRIQVAARMIKSGAHTRVYYLVQEGYDTHAGQLPTQSALFDELAGAVRAFFDDLRAAGLAERVLLMTFSEFGRRVAENGSEGTDHGTAGPVFLVGPSVKPGPFGDAPNLLDLEDGDLKVQADFRRLYAAVLQDWLGLPSSAALGGEFEPLGVLAPRTSVRHEEP